MIKRPSSETACPLSQGSRDSDELCFLSEREREFQFLYKGSLDKKVQWISCQKSQGFRFDRRLLVFHPRSLNIQRREEQKIAGCYKSQPCTCTRKLLLASSTLKKKPKILPGMESIPFHNVGHAAVWHMERSPVKILYRS